MSSASSPDRNRVAFSVPGVPKPKGRPRAVAKLRFDADGKPDAYVQMVTPPDTAEAEAQVRAAFRRRYPDHRAWPGAVMLRFTAVFPIPSGWPKALRAAAERGDVYHTGRPDKDNIEKLVVDALNLIAFVDDSQVQGGGVKRYGSPARLDVVLEHLPAPDRPATPGEKRRAQQASQPELGLGARKPAGPNPTKSGKAPPDLSGYSARTRALIEAAMERDDAARRNRR